MVVAPATYNTVCRLAVEPATGTYALGLLAEVIGGVCPVAMLPFVNTGLAARAPFKAAAESLRADGDRTTDRGEIAVYIVDRDRVSSRNGKGWVEIRVSPPLATACST